MIKNAILDPTRTYRYVLERKWGNSNNYVNFILLNPSTADENIDDPTINGCIALAKNWGYDGFYVTNLFAYRATKPADLKKYEKPVGELNDEHLLNHARKSKMVVVAWGNHGNFLNRADDVLQMLLQTKPLYCLEITQLGNPKHPLYVKRSAQPFLFNKS